MFEQERFHATKGSETKLEEDRKSLKQGLDEAETHLKKAHLSRCALEGEIQRLKMALGDKETERAVNTVVTVIDLSYRHSTIDRTLHSTTAVIETVFRFWA